MGIEEQGKLLDLVVEPKPKKIDFGFPHYAVYAPSDFSELYVVKAMIHEPKLKSVDGLIPGTTMVAMHNELHTLVTLDMAGLPIEKRSGVAYMFHASEIWSDRPSIYERDIAEDLIDKPLRPEYFVGFFRSADKAIWAFLEERTKYLEGLKAKICSIVDVYEIGKKFNA